MKHLPDTDYSMSKKEFVCKCFFTHNFFLKRYNVHVIYESDLQLKKEYGMILQQNGCQTEEQFQEVISQITTELHRRQTLGQERLKRKQTIQESYVKKHPNIYFLKEEYLDKDFLHIVNVCRKPGCTKDDLVPLLHQTTADRVYAFPVFAQHFCKLFMEELENFEASDCPKSRPNTMNRYGILLDELGFDDGFMTPFRLHYLQPIASLLFPDWGGDALDSHKAFIVQYKMGEDLDLSYHYDNAEVTLNVSLGKSYTGGSLYFGDMRTVNVEDTECTEYEHSPCIGIMHRGQHKHGALPIHSGERYNLIIWMRSSRIRNKLCPMCSCPPELTETVCYGDGFTSEGETVNVCALH